MTADSEEAERHHSAADGSHTRALDAPTARPWWRLHLWEFTAARDVFILGGVGLLVWLAYVFRAATAPVLVALFAAYLTNPIVDYTARRWGWPRWGALLFALCLVVGGLATIVFVVGPQLVRDAQTFAEELPTYAEEVDGWIGQSLPRSMAHAASDAQLLSPEVLFNGAMNTLGVAVTMLGAGVYFALAGAFTLALFIYFSLRFHDLPRLRDWLPRSRRAETVELFRRFEKAFGGFLRGQVIVALFTTSGFAIGFSLLGVPYALLVACVGGLLSFIPNGQAAGPILAILAGFLAPGHEFDVFRVIVYPCGVYAITQSLETFVVTPWVQSSQTRLSPLWVMGALIAGGATGGLIGMFLAIPMAACLRIVLREIALPAFKRFVERL